MTIENAIEILIRKCSIPYSNETYDYISEAYDIAIQALEEKLEREMPDISLK